MEKLNYSKFFFYFLFFSFSNLSFFCQNSKCDVILKVDRERNERSTTKSGTYYKMEITNTGNFEDTFIITTSNVNDSKFPSKFKSKPKSDLRTLILDKNKVQFDKITLKAGQTVNFLIRVEIPSNTPSESWCQTQILVQSSNCKSVTTSSILNTLVIDSED